MSAVAKKKTVDRAERLRAEIDELRSAANRAENEADDLQRELSKIEKERKEEERRRKYGDDKRGLASHLVREVLGGDISWLSTDEQERWRAIADIAVDYCADHEEPKP